MNKDDMSDRGRLYWLLINSGKGIKALFFRHPWKVAIGFSFLLGLLILNRHLWQPGLLAIRKNSIAILVLSLIAYFCLRQLNRGHARHRLLYTAASLLVVVALWHWGSHLQNYLTLYTNYRSLNIIQLQQLPLSGNERIYPLNSVLSLAHEAMVDNETPTQPNFVRINGEYHWSSAIEPAYPLTRMFGGVNEILSVSATTPALNFSREGRVKVNFQVGESLLWGRRTNIAVLRSFGLWRMLNFEPATVSYFIDDNGDWIQAVSLIQWKGFFLPRPTFGGVQIIRQESPGVLKSLLRILLGSGEWIKPSQVGDHKFLTGQNILPYQVSRFTAESFRFQGGFFAPLPIYRRGDIRIPDLPEDVNDQPFTSYFTLPNEKSGALYHYFGLEPFDSDKQGLSTSLFMPADGTSKTYIYNHQKMGSALTGVSAISAKVMESRKIYDWSRNRPVEHRPFIRDVGGRRRFFWLTTVVTYKENEQQRRFIAGTLPDVVLTDAEFNLPVWVDAANPPSWPNQLEEELKEIWGTGG